MRRSPPKYPLRKFFVFNPAQVAECGSPKSSPPAICLFGVQSPHATSWPAKPISSSIS